MIHQTTLPKKIELLPQAIFDCLESDLNRMKMHNKRLKATGELQRNGPVHGAFSERIVG